MNSRDRSDDISKGLTANSGLGLQSLFAMRQPGAEEKVEEQGEVVEKDLPGGPTDREHELIAAANVSTEAHKLSDEAHDFSKVASYPEHHKLAAKKHRDAVDAHKVAAESWEGLGDHGIAAYHRKKGVSHGFLASDHRSKAGA